jgi:hypothetical protein
MRRSSPLLGSLGDFERGQAVSYKFKSIPPDFSLSTETYKPENPSDISRLNKLLSDTQSPTVQGLNYDCEAEHPIDFLLSILDSPVNQHNPDQSKSPKIGSSNSDCKSECSTDILRNTLNYTVNQSNLEQPDSPIPCGSECDCESACPIEHLVGTLSSPKYSTDYLGKPEILITQYSKQAESPVTYKCELKYPPEHLFGNLRSPVSSDQSSSETESGSPYRTSISLNPSLIMSSYSSMTPRRLSKLPARFAEDSPEPQSQDSKTRLARLQAARRSNHHESPDVMDIMVRLAEEPNDERINILAEFAAAERHEAAAMTLLTLSGFHVSNDVPEAPMVSGDPEVLRAATHLMALRADIHHAKPQNMQNNTEAPLSLLSVSSIKSSPEALVRPSDFHPNTPEPLGTSKYLSPPSTPLSPHPQTLEGLIDKCPSTTSEFFLAGSYKGARPEGFMEAWRPAIEHLGFTYGVYPTAKLAPQKGFAPQPPCVKKTGPCTWADTLYKVLYEAGSLSLSYLYNLSVALDGGKTLNNSSCRHVLSTSPYFTNVKHTEVHRLATIEEFEASKGGKRKSSQELDNQVPSPENKRIKKPTLKLRLSSATQEVTERQQADRSNEPVVAIGEKRSRSDVPDETPPKRQRSEKLEVKRQSSHAKQHDALQAVPEAVSNNNVAIVPMPTSEPPQQVSVPWVEPSVLSLKDIGLTPMTELRHEQELAYSEYITRPNFIEVDEKGRRKVVAPKILRNSALSRLMPRRCPRYFEEFGCNCTCSIHPNARNCNCWKKLTAVEE